MNDQGTYAAQQRLAREELNRQLQDQPAGPNSKLRRYVACVFAGASHAAELVKMSRSSEGDRPAEFVGRFVRLEAAADEARATNASDDLREWPKSVYTFGHETGGSAMEAGARFAESIRNAAVVARSLHLIPNHGEPYASQIAVGDCGPDIRAWSALTMTELRERTIPAAIVWPSVMQVRTDTERLLLEIECEFDRATKAVSDEWLEPGEAIAWLKLGEVGGKPADGRPVYQKLVRYLPDDHKGKRGNMTVVRPSAWRAVVASLKAASGSKVDWSDAADEVAEMLERRAAEHQKKAGH